MEFSTGWWKWATIHIPGTRALEFPPPKKMVGNLSALRIIIMKIRKKTRILIRIKMSIRTAFQNRGMDPVFFYNLNYYNIIYII